MAKGSGTTRTGSKSNPRGLNTNPLANAAQIIGAKKVSEKVYSYTFAGDPRGIQGVEVRETDKLGETFYRIRPSSYDVGIDKWKVFKEFQNLQNIFYKQPAVAFAEAIDAAQKVNEYAKKKFKL